MKSISVKIAGVFTMLLVLLNSLAVFAQEKTTDINVDINKGGETNWYASPWVWIVGAAVFILLLVALLRGRNAS
ncbi:MAG TPA: hypothetical protein VM935_06595 [Chitinophagaceae bacterium]|jgi:hypothetical protein|nr:hypothetical protein [Chitinophagaceae bacterium]